MQTSVSRMTDGQDEPWFRAGMLSKRRRFWSVVADCSMPALQLQAMRGRRELPDELKAPVLGRMTKARSTPATMSKQRSTLLPKTATMSNKFCVEILPFRQSRTLLRQCCFDIVASVNRALVGAGNYYVFKERVVKFCSYSGPCSNIVI